jgi:hypothetical protein
VRMLFPGLKGSLGFLVRFFFEKFRFLPEKKMRRISALIVA